MTTTVTTAPGTLSEMQHNLIMAATKAALDRILTVTEQYGVTYVLDEDDAHVPIALAVHYALLEWRNILSDSDPISRWQSSYAVMIGAIRNRPEWIAGVIGPMEQWPSDRGTGDVAS